MLKQLDEKIQQMKIEIQRDRKKREENEEYRTIELENRINELRQ